MRRPRRGSRARDRGSRPRRAIRNADEDARATRAERPAERPDCERSRDSEPQAADEESVEGVVELLPNGSGFVRVSPPEPSDDDVYISAAQVKRCELVSGDRVSGPRRAPRRSERFASLVRIDTINGRAGLRGGRRRALRRSPGGVPDRALPARLRGPDDQGDRVADAVRQGLPRDDRRARSRAGKSEALRAARGRARRPGGPPGLDRARRRPARGDRRVGPRGLDARLRRVSFAASADAQDHAVELVIDQARRVAARGARRGGADRHARRDCIPGGPQGAGRGAQHRRRWLADRDRHGVARRSAARPR